MMATLKQFSCALAVAVLGMGLGERAEGAAIANSNLLAASYALGETVDQAVWVINASNSLGNSYYFSGILVRGQEADWVVTAGHPLTSTTWTADYHNLTVGNGSSVYTDRGSTSGVVQMILDYNPNLGHGEGAPPDMTFLKLANRISNPAIYFNITPTPGLNQPITFASYGVPYSMAEGALTNAGHVMGVTGLFGTSQPAGWNTSLYDAGEYNAGDPASGVETAGGSGGFAGRLNPNTGAYDYLGMSEAGNSSATFFLNFNAPSVKARICEVTQPMPAPRPVLAVQLTPDGTALRLAWDAVAVGYRLQTSGDLAGWTNLSSVITAPGYYDDPIASRPRQFYHLWKP